MLAIYKVEDRNNHSLDFVNSVGSIDDECINIHLSNYRKSFEINKVKNIFLIKKINYWYNFLSFTIGCLLIGTCVYSSNSNLELSLLIFLALCTFLLSAFYKNTHYLLVISVFMLGNVEIPIHEVLKQDAKTFIVKVRSKIKK